MALLQRILLVACCFSSSVGLGLGRASGGDAGALDREARDRGPGRLNLVVMIVDDLGWQDASVAFGPERTEFNDRYSTPHLERLAREGLLFTNGYADAPVCSPSRVALMTGQSPARSRVTFWTRVKDKDTSRPHPTLSAPAWRLNSIQPEDVTLALELQRAGYRTIHAGKAHWGAEGTPGEDPTQLGFDVNIAGHAAGGPGSYYGLHRFQGARRPGGGSPGPWDVPGLERYHDQDVYLTEALSIEACAQVREAARRGQPFFLHFAPYAVHAPLMANAKYLARYRDLEPEEAAYATMIESVDHALGALLATLEREGVLDETLFVYTSDNGGLSAHGRGGEKHVHNAPLRSGKGSAYEGGVRVPWVVRWPGVAPPGTLTDTPVTTCDLFPTLLAAAGIDLPPDYAALVDGQDLGPLLRGESHPAERPLVFHMPHQWGAPGPGIEPFSALRLGPLKLLYFHASERFELYDLESDLSESKDLASERPGDVRRLAAVLTRELQARGAQMSIVAETGTPVRMPGEVLGL